MTDRLFEALDRTLISCEQGGLVVVQTDAQGNESSIWIPGRYVDQFIAEIKNAMVVY